MFLMVETDDISRILAYPLATCKEGKPKSVKIILYMNHCTETFSSFSSIVQSTHL